MMDLDNSGLGKECAMMCMEVHCEDGDKDLIVYAGQGVSTEEHDKTMYGELMKPKAKKKMKLSMMWSYALMTVCHWRRKEGDLTKICLTKMYMT